MYTCVCDTVQPIIYRDRQWKDYGMFIVWICTMHYIIQESVCGEIAIQNVSFTYPTRTEVTILDGLSLYAKSGKTLALVGPSGGGKTTITSLIVRFYDNFSGKITLDGTDLKVLNISWLRSQVGVVFQEPVLFDSSIADNIRYGANFREVSDEEIIEAAKLANIHDFIVSLPQV